MINLRWTGMFLFLSSILLIGCREENEMPSEMELDIVEELEVIIDPNNVAPLTAEIKLSTNTDASVRIRIVGKNGSDSDIVHDFSEFGKSFEIPVLGLYPAFYNEVELIFLNENGTKISSKTVFIQTKALIVDLPEIEVITSNQASLSKELYFVNYFGYQDAVFPQRAFMFDKFGDIRWYADYSLHPTLFDLFYDNGMIRLQNGNLAFGDGSTGTIYEIDMLGEILNTWGIGNYGFHHTVIEKPNGNFLATVNDFSKPTVEDVIIEIDRNAHTIINVWDLNESLDNSRKTWNPSPEADWFHANGLFYSESDNCIIVSGRTQGVVKLTQNNEVVWIVAPHKDWETSGNGTDLSQFLLQPIDNQNLLIEDNSVLEGQINHPDFSWAWYQHSPILLPNGNLMVFDNGENRNYTINEVYSRAVEFEINETNQTIKQIWDYGKERGAASYSRIVSKVVDLEEEGNILFTPGAIQYNGEQFGKVIELEKQSKQVLFEAKITPPNSFYIITFHNVNKMQLYGNE